MRKIIVMIGASFDSKGGMSTVASIYNQIGLFERWPIVYLTSYRDGTKLYKLFVAARCILKYVSLLLLGRVVLVHVHVATRASFWRKSVFILVSMAARKPVIFHLHGAEFIHFYNNDCGKIAKGFLRYILNQVSEIVVLSSHWREQLSHITSNANITIIYNPVVIPHNDSCHQEREKNVLLFLGRLGARKGILDLLVAVARLRKLHHEVRLLFGGDGDIISVNKAAEQLGITSAIQYLGWVDVTAKKKLLSTASVYVLPSYNEGLPMGVLEAMAFGMPIVATTVGGIPDAVNNGVEGFLVKPGDITGLVVSISKLLTDDALRKEMGNAARKKVDTLFTPEKIIPHLDKLYRAYDVAQTSSQ